MNVLMLSTDRRMFEEGSAVSVRMKEYGSIVEKLTILVFGAEKELFTHVASNVAIIGVRGKNPFSIWKIIQATASSGSFNLVTAMDPFEVGFFGLRIGKKLGIPVELQIHTDIFSKHFANESFRRIFQQFLAGFTLPRASCVRVASERIAASLQDRKIAIPIKVLPIAVDASAIANHELTTDLHARYPEFSKIVLSLSRLSPEKNIAGIIRAFRQVSQKVPNVGLVIVGDGREEPVLKKLAATHGLGASVVFESWTADSYSYMKTADVFVSNSLYEGYGMSIVEAAIMGKPIVSTPVGVVGYELDAASVEVVPFEDDATVAEAIARALGSNPKIPKFTKPLLSKAAYLNSLQRAWQTCGVKGIENK